MATGEGRDPAASRLLRQQPRTAADLTLLQRRAVHAMPAASSPSVQTATQANARFSPAKADAAAQWRAPPPPPPPPLPWCAAGLAVPIARSAEGPAGLTPSSASRAVVVGGGETMVPERPPAVPDANTWPSKRLAGRCMVAPCCSQSGSCGPCWCIAAEQWHTQPPQQGKCRNGGIPPHKLPVSVNAECEWLASFALFQA